MSPSGRIEVISMGMKTEYKVVTTVEEALDYIGDSKEVAFDFETAPNDGFRDEIGIQAILIAAELRNQVIT